MSKNNQSIINIACELSAAGCSDKVIELVFDNLEKEQDRMRKQEFYTDLRNLQADLKNLIKNSRGHGGIRYTDLATWTANVRTQIAHHNFSLVCTEAYDEMRSTDVLVSLILTHANGHQMPVECRFPRDNSHRGKSDIQAMGSTLTYARRYLLGMLLNVATTDEDPDKDPAVAPDDMLATDNEKNAINSLCALTETDRAVMLKAIGAQSIDTLTKKQAQLALTGLKSKQAKRLKGTQT